MTGGYIFACQSTPWWGGGGRYPPSRSDPRTGVEGAGTPPSRSDPRTGGRSRAGTSPAPHPGQIPGWGRQGDGGAGGYPYWNSIMCACYAAGGMSLAFTQEDFLVTEYFDSSFFILNFVDFVDTLCSNFLWFSGFYTCQSNQYFDVFNN